MLNAQFNLVNILLEGNCYEENSRNPTRGLELVLGTKVQPNVVDTIGNIFAQS